MRLVSFSPKPTAFDSIAGLTFINSDLAFKGNYVYQGNFSGFSIWDVSKPSKPVLASVYPCVTSQGDPSIYGNLLFISAEGNGNRIDCAKGGITDTSDHKSHMAGVRIFDVSNPKAPKLIKNVQTCKGSHTHTSSRARPTRASSTSMCREVRALGRKRSSPGVRTAPIPRIRRTRCFGST